MSDFAASMLCCGGVTSIIALCLTFLIFTGNIGPREDDDKEYIGGGGEGGGERK